MARGYAMPVSEKDWRARGDCETLVEASKIRKDPARLKAAKAAAVKKLKELKEATEYTSAINKGA